MAVLTEMIAFKGGNRTPLMIELPIHKALSGPFLVSSSKGFIWIGGRFPNGTVRAAVRQIPWGFLFRDAVKKVAVMSDEMGWGNFHPPGAEGFRACVEHLEEYDIPEPFEVVYGKGFDPSVIPDEISRKEDIWVPEGWALVLPEDRSFLGTTVDFRDGQRALVLHNPSRGIAIMAPELPDLEAEEPKPVAREAG